MDIKSETDNIDLRRWGFILLFWILVFFIFLAGVDFFSEISVAILFTIPGVFLLLVPFVVMWIILRVLLKKFLDKDNKRPKFYHFICSLIMLGILISGIYFLFFQQMFREGLPAEDFFPPLLALAFLGIYGLPVILFVMFIKLTSKLLKVEQPAFWRSTLSPALINFFLSLMSLSIISILTLLIFNLIIEKYFL